MQTDILKSFSEFNNSTLEAAKALGEINSRLVEKAIKQHFKAADLLVESGLKQAKLVQDNKDIKDFLSNQTALMEEYTGKFVDLAKSNVTVAQEVGAEYKAWIEQGMQKAETTVKSVAKKASAAAA